MPITEIIMPHLNPDPVVVKKLQETLLTAAKPTFSSNPGMLAFYRGKIIQARNISDRTDAEHYGLALLLEWDEVSSFNAFWASGKFASFKKTIMPYMLRPVEPMLFCSEEQSRSGGTTTAKYTQYLKVSGVDDTNKSETEDSWKTLVSQLQGHASVFHAWGVQDTTGVFAGMVGWDSLEALQAANEQQSVKSGIEALARYGKVLSYVMELEKQSSITTAL